MWFGTFGYVFVIHNLEFIIHHLGEMFENEDCKGRKSIQTENNNCYTHVRASLRGQTSAIYNQIGIFHRLLHVCLYNMESY